MGFKMQRMLVDTVTISSKVAAQCMLGMDPLEHFGTHVGRRERLYMYVF